MGDLTRDEFLAHMGYLREDIAGVHTRLDALNGQTRKHGEAIAVLQDRDTDSRSEARKGGLISGATAGTFVGGIIVALYQYFGGGK